MKENASHFLNINILKNSLRIFQKIYIKLNYKLIKKRQYVKKITLHR